MITKRYKYARDVKMLALGAEITEQESVAPNEDGEILLPSGIKLVIDVSKDTKRTDLLSPHLWERRRQLKDRVYEIDVNGRKYILKEKKTARHTDTKEGGHREGRLSSEEFETAQHFQENGTVSNGRLSVGWEQPVGYSSYPYQHFINYDYPDAVRKRRWFNRRPGRRRGIHIRQQDQCFFGWCHYCLSDSLFIDLS